jgi:RND superfamily putative drug exporter
MATERDPTGTAAGSGHAAAPAASGRSASGARDQAAGPSSTARRWLVPALGIVAFLVAAGPLGSLAGNLADVQRSDSSSYLPQQSEAARAQAASERFTGMESTTAIVVYTGSAALTEADRAQIILAILSITEQFHTRLAGQPIGPIISDDRQAAQVIVPLAGSDSEQIRAEVEWLRRYGARTSGLDVHVAGPAAAVADLTEVFSAVDGVLVGTAATLILLILIAAYRSPVLPLLVLVVAGVALGVANGAAYLLAREGVLTVAGDARGILNVLVLGAGTDYALLLVSRFREELRRSPDRYQAMHRAWRGSAPPILASGATVIAGLLFLLASEAPSTRGLGPVAAVGVGSALVTMLGLLPLVLVLVGRAGFWPFRPRYGSAPAAEKGAWARVAARLGRRPRLVWVLASLALAGLAFGLVRLEASGIPRTESFLATVDSVVAQDLLVRHFPDAAGTPAMIVANADRLDDVVAAAAATPGITEAEPYADRLAEYDARLAGEPPPGALVVDGLGMVEATLAPPADSAQAREVVSELRREVHAVPGAAATVGGYTAANLDIQATTQRDRLIVIPLVLGAVLLILMLLLRAVVAPLLLTATVVLSFAAALGVSGVVFRDLLGFAGADSTLPLFAFVFLVALGVDYSIFLLTRVREETRTRGTREGVRVGLAVTGAVITSAGIVLAATFSALAVIPLLFLVQIAFLVAVGVLIDTFIVRSLLVPGLCHDIGDPIWWPSRLARDAGHAEPQAEVAEPGRRPREPA